MLNTPHSDLPAAVSDFMYELYADSIITQFLDVEIPQFLKYFVHCSDGDVDHALRTYGYSCTVEEWRSAGDPWLVLYHSRITTPADALGNKLGKTVATLLVDDPGMGELTAKFIVNAIFSVTTKRERKEAKYPEITRISRMIFDIAAKHGFKKGTKH